MLLEYRAHHEALAEMLRGPRPGLDVIDVDPDRLDGSVIEQHPDLVISSRLSEVIETRVFGWALLYLGGQNHAVLSLAGQRSLHEGIRVDELLAFIDDAMARRYA